MRTRIIITLMFGIAACGPQPMVVHDDPTSVAIAGLSSADLSRHRRGDALFERTWRASQGLGPLYIRSSCSACHAADVRGPGAVQRMSIVQDDGVTAVPDLATLLPYGTAVRPQFTAGATQALLPPELPNVKLSLRVGPATFGRAYIEAIPDQAIVDLAADQEREGLVSGRVNWLDDAHTQIGRFGVKGRLGTIEAFVADAFRGDMGLTSPQRPDEPANPDQLTDDDLPGVDLTAENVEDVAFYVRTLAMPSRTGLTDQGAALFAQSGCASCHTPSLPMRSDYEVTQIAGQQAEVFSDLLLHDMGTELADGIVDASATEREWRTTPLMGLRHSTSFLHDGRATTLDDAIRMHRGTGSEANFSVDRFEALSEADRELLIDYVSRL